VSATKYQTHTKGQARHVHIDGWTEYSTPSYKKHFFIKRVANSFNLCPCLLLSVLAGSSAICIVAGDSSFIAVTLPEHEAHQ
jgi:hypothetical protein